MDWVLFIVALLCSAFIASLLTNHFKEQAQIRRTRKEIYGQSAQHRFENQLFTLYVTKKVIKEHEYRWLRAHWSYATRDSDELIIQSLPDYHGEIIKS